MIDMDDGSETTGTEALLQRNEHHVRGFEGPGGGPRPALAVAVVGCMDTRLDFAEILGLRSGEAHVIRNAGGVATDEVVRSLALSQRMLGTREILMVHHTDCGLEGLDEDAFFEALLDEAGRTPDWDLHAFEDPFVSVEMSVTRLRHEAFLPHRDRISGFVYDVDTGRLHPVDPA